MYSKIKKIEGEDNFKFNYSVTSPITTLQTIGKRSSTYWVFWYYGDDGDKQCGNYCIVAFSVVVFLILCIILCGCLKCYFMRQRYKEEDRFTGDTNIENALFTLWSDQALKDRECNNDNKKKCRN
jgi:hypothetical protein